VNAKRVYRIMKAHTVVLSFTVAARDKTSERQVSPPGRERPDNVSIEPEQPADAPMRKLPRLSSVIDPRAADLQISGHIVRVPEAIALALSSPSHYAPIWRVHELLSRCVVIIVSPFIQSIHDCPPRVSSKS
jgi:hypothetical protein